MSEDKIEVNMNIYDIPILVEQLEKANKEIERLNSIINNDFSKICREKMIDKLSANEMILLQDKEIERLNKIRQQVIDELFELKDMIYKPETREINFDVQRKISSMIVKLGDDKE